MFLDALLIVGVLTTLISGVDLFVRPHQKRQIESFLEDITLEAEQLRPMDWSVRIQEPSVLAVLVMVTYFEFALFYLAIFLLQAPTWREGGIFHAQFGEEGQLIQGVGVLISAVTLSWAWRWPLPQLMRWLLPSSGNWATLKWISFIFGGMAFFAIYNHLVNHVVSGQWLLDLPVSWQRTVTMLAMLPIWPLIVIFWIVAQGVSIASYPRSWFTLVLFSAFKATMWRIVEYNKEAVAALTLILTILLGVLKLLLG